MTVGFLVYTLLILTGHVVGFPLSYAYLHTVCPSGCALTPGNARALAHSGLSISFYATLYLVIQALYILICVGIAVLIVVKKPGQWVPLGMSAFLVGLSAYEGANYPALAAAYPVLYAPTQLLIDLGMGLLGMYALLTFPNGQFGSLWAFGFYLVNLLATVLFAFLTTPVFILISTVFSPQTAQSPLLLVSSTLVIAAFSATLRQEVDLEQLSEHLLSIVQETMQPASLSLWIRPLKHEIASAETVGEAHSRGNSLTK